jgi:hypothetical protein
MANWIQNAVPKSHEGLFSKQAKKAHMGVQAFASKVLGSNSKASATTKHRAQFALNVSKISKDHHSKHGN